ncbi:MAG TPA: pyridoxal phosphate-dependent aminotransferase family protein [Actinomycetota bacterium]|nr:pyridoxal phosphate-dependent aminotransferase family protein [Actinomycetota bacterium]
MPTPDHADAASESAAPEEPRPQAEADGVMPGAERPRRRRTDAWLSRWMAQVADLGRMRATHPMLDAVIDEQVGRRIRIDDRWLADFASSNYLGFDLDPEIAAAVPEHLARWGTQPSWSRMLGSPVLYRQIEERVSELIGAEDALVLPSTTLIHLSVIPLLAGGGMIFLDGRAHKTLYDGAMIARSHGASVQRFRHNDHEHLEDLLRASAVKPRLIAIDGVNSMTGNAPDVRELTRLARTYGALLYVDDSHGLGVIGERGTDELSEWGKRGNGVVRHQGETYESVVLVAGFSRAFSSTLAFIALPSALKDALKVAAPPYLYSGPSAVASLATALAGLAVNDTRGDLNRYEAYRKTQRVLDRLHELGVWTPNRSGFPIVQIPLANPDDLEAVGRCLFDRGVYVTMAVYPLVPRDEAGFRVQVTAANADDEVDLLCEVLGEVDQRFELLHGRTRHAALEDRAPA